MKLRFKDEVILVLREGFDENGHIIPNFVPHLVPRQTLARIIWKGFIFYWNDYAEPGFYNERGVTCAMTGKRVLSTNATNINDVLALLRSRLELNWDKYLKLRITEGAKYYSMQNGLFPLI